MRHGVLGMVVALVGSITFAATAEAADYQAPRQVYMQPPPPVYQPAPVQASCCCPTVRRGFTFNVGCGSRNVYGGPDYHPQYAVQQPYPTSAYYQHPYQSYQQPYPAYAPHYDQPGYAPSVGVGVGIGPVGVGVATGRYSRY